MLEMVGVNLLKAQEWELEGESIVMMGELIVLAVNELTSKIMNEAIHYVVTFDELEENIPTFKSKRLILKSLKSLHSKGLITLMIEGETIYFMFTEKGASWLVYDYQPYSEYEGMKYGV